MSDVLTFDQQDEALRIVADWLGGRMGYDGPAPTGREAYWKGSGPLLEREWSWPASGDTPAILLEGGPFDWAVEVSCDMRVVDDLADIGVFAEPYAPYALCLYPL